MDGIGRIAAIAVLLASSTLMLGCQTTPTEATPGAAGGTLPSDEEITAMLVGNSIQGLGDGVVPFTIFFPDGGMMRAIHSFRYKDQGTWRVASGTWCGRWENWWGTKERCWRVHLDDETLIWQRVGDDAADDMGIELVEGNPADL